MPPVAGPVPILPEDRLALTAGFAVDGSQLEIPYIVRNNRDSTIWLLDTGLTYSPPYYEACITRTILEGPRGAVVSCWWDYREPPPGNQFCYTPVFYGTPVAGRQQHLGVLRLRLPLAAPEYPGIASGTQDSCNCARFETGVILDGP